MKGFAIRRTAFQLVIGTLVMGILAGAQSRGGAENPSTLLAKLRSLQSSLSDQTDSQALASLPPAWETEAAGHRYSISTGPLRAILASGRQTRTEEARLWLDQLAGQLEGFIAEPPRAAADDRAKLNKILSRPEFASAGPPNALERLRDRVRAWIGDFLNWLFSFTASHPSTSQILFWVALVGAVSFLVLWMVRLWSRDIQSLKLPTPNQISGEARTWEEWVRAARMAAEQGDSQQAIHCSYWAGVIRLQGVGALPSDRTLTPREYLRSFAPGNFAPAASDNNVAGPNSRQPLAALTQALERFWYARRSANNEDFRESLRHLAALGCDVE
jgi:hypothetical protein